jgi:DNA-binding YbaB/EbfC family protein
MFKEFSQLASLLKNLPRAREEMEKWAQRLGQIHVEAESGGGLVRVQVNGRLEVTSCTLSDDALRLGDKEMLEELIRSAVNEGLRRARQAASEEAGKLALSLGLPPDLNWFGHS